MSLCVKETTNLMLNINISNGSTKRVAIQKGKKNKNKEKTKKKNLTKMTKMSNMILLVNK